MHRSIRVVAVALSTVLLLGSAIPPLTVHAGGAATPSGERTAREVVERWLTLWRIGDYEAMHEALAAADRDRYTVAGFVRLHRDFADAVGLTAMRAAIGSPRATARPADDGSSGPSQAVVIPVRLVAQTAVFGEIVLNREVELTRGDAGWEPRWTPGFVFPVLGTIGGSFTVVRGPLPTRGRILAADGTVLAMTRPDGKRVYPQESLAGQVVGFAAPLTEAEAAARPAGSGFATGQYVGRRGVESGADALLRGRASLRLLAVPHTGPARVVIDQPSVPGADVTLTIRPHLQRAAEAVLAPYAEAATAIVDPTSGDVWALASAPAFNPNAMTLGTTLGGARLAQPSAHQMRNHALETAHPAGSSFKPFTLAAALQIGVATPATRMTCAPTWELQGFTFRNYLNHELPGRVSLVEAMAFSCNTTYMPLSMLVYQRDRDALTDLISDFGFGQPTGIGWLSETTGVLPDALWFEGHTRWHGGYSSFGPFDQVQLSIGQGSFTGTQLQLALAYAAFANRGTLWEPRLVTSATTPRGQVLLATEPQVRRHIAMTRDQLDYLVTALEAVTTYSYGTGTAAFAGFGIPVAAKSGTAETGGPDPHALFPAFAPSDDPQIVVAMLLARVHLGTGGSRAAPLVRRVLNAYFRP